MTPGPGAVAPGAPAEILSGRLSSPESGDTSSSPRGNGRTLSFLPKTRAAMILFASVVVASWIWQATPTGGMELHGMRFLATLTVAATLWMLDVVDEYIVALMLLLAWVILGVVPPKVALGGFSEHSWLFVVGALGIAAGVGQTKLLQRFALRLLSLVSLQYYKGYTFILLGLGSISSLLLPTGKARVAVVVPLSQAISDASGFASRSNGSATISLAALLGFGQMSFLFLTGGEHCLIAWNFLSPMAKAEFGWLSWSVAALPAGLCILLFMFGAIHLLLPLSSADKARLLATTTVPALTSLGPMTGREWITLTTLLLTVVGWLTSSWHGVNEAWVALAALLVFLLTGILDNSSFKNRIDWGLILFFGVLNSISTVGAYLKIDLWFTSISGPFLAAFAHDPLMFLATVVVMVSLARLVLRKAPVVTLFALTLLPLSSTVGIHPGVLLLVVVMAGECFLLGYQDGPYQIAYAGNGGAAFSHGQARKILGAKYLATLFAIAVSVPYWRWLGFVS